MRQTQKLFGQQHEVWRNGRTQTRQATQTSLKLRVQLHQARIGLRITQQGQGEVMRQSCDKLNRQQRRKRTVDAASDEDIGDVESQIGRCRTRSRRRGGLAGHDYSLAMRTVAPYQADCVPTGSSGTMMPHSKRSVRWMPSRE